MSAAERLTRAARVLRERAEAAPDTPPMPARVDIDHEGTCDGCSEGRRLVASYPEPNNEPWLCAECAADADFQAIVVSPPFALAVADWLDHVVEESERVGHTYNNLTSGMGDVPRIVEEWFEGHPAMDVASAVLGEDAGGDGR